jgi:hypothetical protein
MLDHEKRQLYDEIRDGTLDFSDVSIEKLKAMKKGWLDGVDYRPCIEFFTDADNEIRRRQALPKKPFNRDFFG